MIKIQILIFYILLYNISIVTDVNTKSILYEFEKLKLIKDFSAKIKKRVIFFKDNLHLENYSVETFLNFLAKLQL